MELSPKDLEVLSGSALFRGLDPARVRAWTGLEGCTARRYDRGQIIYDADHVQKSLGILLAGHVRVGKDTDDGRGLFISRLAPGALFGAAALFHDQPGYVTVLTALEPCRVLLLSQELLRSLMQQDFALTENYLRYLSQRILFLNEKIAQLSAGSAELRLAHYLLETARPDPSGQLVSYPGSMTALASRLNVGRASVYRALDALQAQGMILREGKRVLILDARALEKAE